jgi:NDP-hexose 4-ketoreductase
VTGESAAPASTATVPAAPASVTPTAAPPTSTAPLLAGRSVAVLGAEGFLGRHICAALAAAGAHGLRISRNGAGGSGPGPQRLRPVALDLVAAPPARLARLLAETDVVVNAAGIVWQAGERQMYRTNAHFVARLAQIAAGLPRGPRLIHLGSVHEYSPVPAGSGVAEDQPTAPVSAYGRSKLLGAKAVLRASRTLGVQGVVLRIATVSGPGAPRGSLLGTVAHHVAEAARAREAGREPEPLELAPLRTQRDFVDVRDVADAVVAAACAPAADVVGRVVNIGSGEAVDTREVVARLIALGGVPVEVVERPGRAATRTDVQRQQLDISRARLLLGWQPRRSLDESLRDLLASAGHAPVPARPDPARQNPAGPDPAGRDQARHDPARHDPARHNPAPQEGTWR